MHQPKGRHKTKHSIDGWLTQSFSFQSRLCAPSAWGRERNIRTNWLQGLLYFQCWHFPPGFQGYLYSCKYRRYSTQKDKLQLLSRAVHSRAHPPGELSLPCSRQDSQWGLLGRCNLKTALVEASSKQLSSKTPAGLLLPASSSEPGPACLPSQTGAAPALDAFWQVASFQTLTANASYNRPLWLCFDFWQTTGLWR